ncbi:MAG: hypothetical protein V1663_00645 [archaeon]
MKKISLIRELEKYPVFNLNTVRNITEKDSNYSKLLVYRLKKEGLIFEVEKNKYTLNKDPFVIASNIIWPCYISFWSALRYYNLTEQLPQNISVVTTRARKKKEIKFNDIKIVFTTVKGKYFFGYNKERYQNFDIFIANKEKALIDSVLFKRVSFSEICDIIKKNIDEIDIELMIDYLIKIKNKALIKRFGFLFYKLNINIYDKLKKCIDSNYVVLDYSIKGNNKKNKKWGVIENVSL